MIIHRQKRWRLKFRVDPDAGRVLFIGPWVVSFDVTRRSAPRTTRLIRPADGNISHTKE